LVLFLDYNLSGASGGWSTAPEWLTGEFAVAAADGKSGWGVDAEIGNHGGADPSTKMASGSGTKLQEKNLG
jgi:hypothetical protein